LPDELLVHDKATELVDGVAVNEDGAAGTVMVLRSLMEIEAIRSESSLK